MPFVPLHLLILFDDNLGYCAKVVPTMKEMLENRAFIVDVHRIQDGPIDISSYRGVIIGAPVVGMGFRRMAPGPDLFSFIQDLPDLDDFAVAIFCVYPLQPGTSLERMKGLLLEKGAEVVASRGYPLLRLDPADTVIPAECMARIR